MSARLGRWTGRSPAAGIAVDLLDDGVLWAINASVFHPRGFALARCTYPDGQSELRLLGDGRERWYYQEDEAAESADTDARFVAFQALLDRATASGGSS